MKVLVISKPMYDNIMPLVEFPSDGDNFYINNSIKTISNSGSLTAITLAKYGLDVSFTGMVGEDYIGNKIKEYIELNKMTQKDIAEILEVEPGTISKYELGITEPNIESLKQASFYELEKIIHPLGLSNTKAKNIIQIATILNEMKRSNDIFIYVLSND